MVPRLLRLHPQTYHRLIRLSKEAEQEGSYRVAKRLQAVVLNSEGRTSGDLARILKAPRSKVSEWLARYQAHGVQGLLEGYRSGRPARLTEAQRRLGDILDSSPVAYGLDTGIWTSPMIAWVVEEEFGVVYHPGHVRKLLHDLGFSVQRPRRVLARADRRQQDRWHRYIYPRLKKSPHPEPGADFYRRSQFPAGLHPAHHLEPGGPSARGPRHRRTQEREDLGRRRTLECPLPLRASSAFQCLHLFGLLAPTGPPLPPPRGHPPSGQRLLS